MKVHDYNKIWKKKKKHLVINFSNPFRKHEYQKFLGNEVMFPSMPCVFFLFWFMLQKNCLGPEEQ